MFGSSGGQGGEIGEGGGGGPPGGEGGGGPCGGTGGKAGGGVDGGGCGEMDWQTIPRSRCASEKSSMGTTQWLERMRQQNESADENASPWFEPGEVTGVDVRWQWDTLVATLLRVNAEDIQRGARAQGDF